MRLDGTSNAMAEVAQAVCDYFADVGPHGSHLPIGTETFDMAEVAMCSRFVRMTAEAASGLIFPEFGATARETERLLRRHGLQIEGNAGVRPGTIVCFNIGGCKWGHIGIVRTPGQSYFENTSSASRGPGFVVSGFAEIGWGRVSGYYNLLPARAAAPGAACLVGGRAIPCTPRMVGELMTVEAAPFLTALHVSIGTIPEGIIHTSGRAFVSELKPLCDAWRFEYAVVAGVPTLSALPRG